MANDLEVVKRRNPFEAMDKRPAKDPTYAKLRMHKYAKAKSFKAIQEVYKTMVDPESTRPVKLQAAQIILERAFGKAQQDVEITNSGRTLEDMLRAIWYEKHVSGSDDKLIEAIEEPSE